MTNFIAIEATFRSISATIISFSIEISVSSISISASRVASVPVSSSITSISSISLGELNLEFFT